jgi:hypothetical protein
MIKITSAVKALLSSGYFINDREVSDRPIMNGITYKQN